MDHPLTSDILNQCVVGMSDINNEPFDPESSVVSVVHRCWMWLWRHNLRCSANLFRISSIRLFIARLPPISYCNIFARHFGASLHSTQPLFRQGSWGFIEENESWFSGVLFVIHRYAMKLRGFREDVREITMR